MGGLTARTYPVRQRLLNVGLVCWIDERMGCQDNRAIQSGVCIETYLPDIEGVKGAWEVNDPMR